MVHMHQHYIEQHLSKIGPTIRRFEFSEKPKYYPTISDPMTFNTCKRLPKKTLASILEWLD